MTNYYKTIKRLYCANAQECVDHNFKEGLFVAQGQWSNGQLAYSRINEDEEVLEDCCYVQMRFANKYVMMHV